MSTPTAKRLNQPLTCRIEDGQLVFRVGLDVLEHATIQPDYGPFAQWPRQPRILDKELWAKDIRDELLKEEEDGSFPLSALLDDAMLKAAENGSIGLEY